MRALLLSVLATSLHAHAWGALTIAGITATPGAKASGNLLIPARGDSGTIVPFSIIRGATSGPTLALIGGTHGSEVAPIVALQRVRADIDPTHLKGTLLIVHVAN